MGLKQFNFLIIVTLCGAKKRKVATLVLKKKKSNN
jgi:hypothetical protein